MTENAHETAPGSDDTAAQAPRVPPTPPPTSPPTGGETVQGSVVPSSTPDPWDEPATPTSPLTPSSGPVISGNEPIAESPAPTPPVEEWDPLKSPEPVETPIKASGGRATLICRRWSGRQRLAYEDAITQRMMVEKADGEETIALGTLRLYAISLTIIGATGFPPHPHKRDWFAGGRENVELDLMLIADADTADEIREIALNVQPLPSLGTGENQPGDDKGKGGKPGDASDPQQLTTTSSTSPVSGPPAPSTA